MCFTSNLFLTLVNLVGMIQIKKEKRKRIQVHPSDTVILCSLTPTLLS